MTGGLKHKADFLICGAGILGLAMARELARRGHENIVVLEKEESLGKHASGRNSGVLHAGIYYTPDSLKARFCLSGNRMMKDYCREKGLPLDETGKVIVAKSEEELPALQGLYERARANGAQVELIDEKQLAEIEPNARTCGTAIYSPLTAVIDPKAILGSLHEDLLSSGVEVLTGTAVHDAGEGSVATNRGEIGFGRFINCAGAYSDRIARLFGVGLGYRLIPFKGVYRKLVSEKAHLVKGNIYPVPDVRNPFLGVHFTRSIHGDVYVGPTAIPALGRENYGILEGLSAEALNILLNEAALFMANPRFRSLAASELPRYLFRYFYEDARKLVKELDPSYLEPSDKVGIRPQLVDIRRKELVMDFLVVEDGGCVHVLNSISPAFTSAMSFAEFVVNQYVEGR